MTVYEMIKELRENDKLIAFETAEKWSEDDEVTFISLTVDFINLKADTVLTVEFFDTTENVIELAFGEKFDKNKYVNCDRYYELTDLLDVAENHEGIVEDFLLGW